MPDKEAEMKNIVDNKTCMIRVNLSAEETNRWKDLTDQIDGGRNLSAPNLKKWFKRKNIPPLPGKENDLTRAQHLLAKATYGILQVSCVPTNGKRVGVFFRQEKEGPTGREKLTSGFSLIRSWSPLDTKIQTIQSIFETKTGFIRGNSIEFQPFGMGYNELSISPESMGPAYLFMVYKVICSAKDFSSGEQGATDKKSGEKFIGFFDPEALYQKETSYQDEPIIFEARMDNLILRSLATGNRKTSSGVLATFNQDSWISGGDMLFESVDQPTENDKKLMKMMERLIDTVGPSVAGGLIYDWLKTGGNFFVYLYQHGIDWLNPS
jgi:hypothetical protein